MKIFACVCEQVLFFESVTCTRCGRVLAFLPDRGVVAPLETEDARYRPCRNYDEHAVCNWAVPEGEAGEYCRACRLNQTIPNLADPAAKAAWQRLEIAKRRLIFTLLELGLPVEGKAEDPERGLAFAFLKDDPADDAGRVLTGHSNGLVTINVAEADAPFREQMREQMGETYRTLLGHFRHESGHYYWERLIQQSPWEARFRELFGDERADYGEAQQRHYAAGPPAGWQESFVSAYASMHPWEDWAETWAHYLHMADTLETARAWGLALRPQPAAEVPSPPPLAVRRLDLHSFEDLMTGWIPLTIALNSLNRSMGLPDPYPFVLAAPAVEKLGFVHEVIEASATRSR